MSCVCQDNVKHLQLSTNEPAGYCDWQTLALAYMAAILAVLKTEYHWSRYLQSHNQRINS
jgi:hypothetical protein